MTRWPSSGPKLHVMIETGHAMGRQKSREPAATGSTLTSAPDYSEPLQAWRLWEIEDVEAAPRLRSLYRVRFWPVGAPLEARCEAHRFRLPRWVQHAAPAETCTCGIYAVRFDLIRTLAQHDRLPPLGRSLVLGTVFLWGDVVECERGWRAALAYPSRLFMPLGSPDAAETAAGLGDYGVPVELLDTCRIADVLDAVADVATRRPVGPLLVRPSHPDEQAAG
jgi:hypothetical protein